MSDLSFVAQAVLDAGQKYATQAWSDATHQRFNLGITAALEAAVDQVVPEEPLYGGDQRWMYERDARQESRKKLLAIVAELKGCG